MSGLAFLDSILLEREREHWNCGAYTFLHCAAALTLRTQRWERTRIGTGICGADVIHHAEAKVTLGAVWLKRVRVITHTARRRGVGWRCGITHHYISATAAGGG